MRDLLSVCIAVGVGLAALLLVSDDETVKFREEAKIPGAGGSGGCGHCCSSAAGHRKSGQGKRASSSSVPAGVLWEGASENPASAPSSVLLENGLGGLDAFQPGSRHRWRLSSGDPVPVSIRSRHVHADGTVAVSGVISGAVPGRLHLQWNDADEFFLGQIYYEGLPVAYRITRGPAGHVITRHAVDEMVCAEVDGRTGQVAYGLPPVPASLAMESEGTGGGGSGGEEGAGLVPALNSYPGATAVVYLDFDGELVVGTSWGSSINAQATGYGASKITEIWRRVSADMEPFNLNVTTDESVYLAAPASRRIRCIITPSNEWYGSNTAGGVAKLGSFTWSGDTPCWVFSDNLANGSKYIAEACSHEVGHTFGLSHDGKSGSAYYSGHGSGAVGWAPIMGNGYFKSMTQWSKGEYSSATNTQNDLAIITSGNGFGYRSDDHGNQASGATYLLADGSSQIAASGNIEKSGDTDVFEFESGAGDIALDISPSSSFGNLDIRAELYDFSGNLVSSSNPSTQLGASLSASVATGTYFLHVRATGYGSADTGFTEYASLGGYEVSGQLVGATGPSPYEVAVSSLPETERGPGDDPDGDGLDNLTEHALGRNPAVADAPFTFVGMDTGGATVDFLLDLPADIPSDVEYVVQASCTLNDPDWTSVATRAPGGGWSGAATVTEETGPAGLRRFRVVETGSSGWTCRFVRVQFRLSVE